MFSGNFCAEVNATTGGAPRTTATGSFSPRAFAFSQWTSMPGRSSSDGFMPRRLRPFSYPR